jgi:hypothetical protein
MTTLRRTSFVALALLFTILVAPLAAGKPELASPSFQVNDDPAKPLLPAGDKGLSGPKFGPEGVPPNDLCANAQVVAVPSSTAGTTVDATFDGVGTCGTSNTAPGVWYTDLQPGELRHQDLRLHRRLRRARLRGRQR